MKMLRFGLLAGVVLLGISWFSQTKILKKTIVLHQPDKKISHPVPFKKLEQKAVAAKLFIQKKGFNPTICFLLDMSLPSGQDRFFIYDLGKGNVKSSGLVAHGNCFESWLEGRRYSNLVGSGCTSLGKYKIGLPYTGKFGYSYKLYGLDSSNKKAYERTVVLHSHPVSPKLKWLMISARAMDAQWFPRNSCKN